MWTEIIYFIAPTFHNNNNTKLKLVYVANSLRSSMINAGFEHGNRGHEINILRMQFMKSAVQFLACT